MYNCASTHHLFICLQTMHMPLRYYTSRWTPVVKDFMVGAVTGELDTKSYPAVKGTPQAMVEAGSGGEEVTSARKGKRNWAKNRNKADDEALAAVS